MSKRRPETAHEAAMAMADFAEKQLGITLFPWQVYGIERALTPGASPFAPHRRKSGRIMVRRPPPGGSAASDARDTGQIVPPPLRDFDAEPYTARVVLVRPGWYELQIHQGPMRYGWQGDGFSWIHSLGTREQAERKAKRIVDRLNRKRLANRAHDSEGTEIR